MTSLILEIMIMNDFIAGKKWIGSFFLCLFLVSCSSIREGPSNNHQIPVHFLSCSDAPMVHVNIEGSEYVLMLDLGANIHLILKDRVLQKLEHKEPVGTSFTTDIQGNKYAQPKYQLRSYQIGNFNIKNPTASEESIFFVKTGSRLFPSKNDRRINQKIEQVDGKVGSEFILSSGQACFLDMSRSLLYIGDTLQDLIDLSCLTEFQKQPLEIENGCLCVNIQTNEGMKRFLLDTGAERSAIKKKPSDPKLIKIYLEDLGLWKFFTLNFPEGLPPFDGILGIDFLKKHIVILDFLDRKIYIK